MLNFVETPKKVKRRRGQSVNQSINQSISQLVSQSINQSINQSISQSVGQSVSQSINQSINQSVSQSVSQSVNQSINQSINQSFIQSNECSYRNFSSPERNCLHLQTHNACSRQMPKRYNNTASYLQVRTFFRLIN